MAFLNLICTFKNGEKVDLNSYSSNIGANGYIKEGFFSSIPVSQANDIFKFSNAITNNNIESIIFDCKDYNIDIIPHMTLPYRDINITENNIHASHSPIPNKMFTQLGCNGEMEKITILNTNFSTVKYMNSMFEKCHNLKNIIGNIDMSNAINSYCMFTGCYNLTSFPIWNTRNVINMGGMFENCWNLTSISLDTSNVADMRGMFEDCRNLVNISDLNIENVTDMTDMFWCCYNLTRLPNFIFSNNLSEKLDHVGKSYMFYNCANLINMNIPISHVDSGMFSGCKNLQNINLIENNYSINTIFNKYCLIRSDAFDSCYSISNFSNINNIVLYSNHEDTFRNCSNIINLPNCFVTYYSRYKDMTITFQNVFSNCFNLKNINISFDNNVRYVMEGIFNNCYFLSNESLINIAKGLPNRNMVKEPYSGPQ